MSNYRETMAQTLEFMHIMHEYKILERSLTDTEQKRREEIAQDMNDADFKDRYGERWKEVKMAVATKQAKNESVEEARQLKDPKKEMMVSKGGKVEVINKKDWDKYKKKGYIQAEEVELDEDNMDLMRKAAKGAMQTIKFKDGKLKMDSFTASGIMGVYDKVNPKNKASIEKMINSGTKAQIMKLQSLAMKAAKGGRREEVEIDEEWKVGDKAFYMGKRVKITKVWPKGGYQIDGKTNVSGNELSFKEQWEKKLKKIRGNTAGAEGQRAAIEDDIAREKEKKNPDKKLIESDLDEGKFQVKTAATKKGKITVTDFDNLKDAKKHLADMEKKGQRGIISKDGKPVKEEVELDEKTKWKMGDGRPRGGPHIENVRFWDLPKDQLQYIMKDAGQAMKANPTARKASGKWADEVNDASTVLGWRKKNGIKEEVELNERPYRVTNPDLGVWSGDARSDSDAAEKAMRKWGVRKGAAASRNFMKKTKVKKEFDFLDHLEIDEGKMSQLHQLIKDKKTPEEIAKIMKLDVKTIKTLMNSHHPEDVVEGAAADARRAMRADPDMKQRGFSKDVTATDDDIKGASKNIIMQMRKAQSLSGNFAVEFEDKKKVKIPAKIAVAVQQKFNSFRKPADKEKFQARVAKSYKDMLTALKESAKQENTILNRIATKIQERKNG